MHAAAAAAAGIHHGYSTDVTMTTVNNNRRTATAANDMYSSNMRRPDVLMHGAHHPSLSDQDLLNLHNSTLPLDDSQVSWSIFFPILLFSRIKHPNFRVPKEKTFQTNLFNQIYVKLVKVLILILTGRLFKALISHVNPALTTETTKPKKYRSDLTLDRGVNPNKQVHFAGDFQYQTRKPFRPVQLKKVLQCYLFIYIVFMCFWLRSIFANISSSSSSSSFWW